MPPKNKGKAKDKDAGADSGSKSGSKLKPATSINVRHILCEKHSNKEKALERLREGHKFDEVARDLSEDKARQGASIFFLYYRVVQDVMRFLDDDADEPHRRQSRLESPRQLNARF